MQSEQLMNRLSLLLALLMGGTTDYAITHGLTPFVSMQNHHSLVYREEEREMFPTLKHFGVGIIPWSPLARGLLTRPFKGDTRTTRGDSDRCVCSRAASTGLSNPLTRLSSSAISGYLEGPGTEDIINRFVASAYWQVHERDFTRL